MGLGMSFQACNCIALVIVLPITYIDNVVQWSYTVHVAIQRSQTTDIEYDLEVEVSSKTSEQQDTSDDDEPEAAYANEPLDKNWQAQYEAERQKKQESPVSLLLL